MDHFAALFPSFVVGIAVRGEDPTNDQPMTIDVIRIWPSNRQRMLSLVIEEDNLEFVPWY